MEDRRVHDEKVLVEITKVSSHFEKDGIIPSIKKQVEKTNGRVTKLEQWRWIVVGGFLAISMTMGIPAFISCFTPEKETISENDMRQLITEVLDEEINI